ncbi:CobW family GTP-binding protein, partial [Delftia acidovorans]
MGQRLPFTVIGGFLGAGKTTLLNHWLRHADGQRLAVLVNDFGALNIDAGLIKAHSGDTIALTNGCVCCQIGDDLSMALIGVLQQRERFDAVVVEASGVSDPWRIAQLGLADPALALDGVIVVVDAAALPGQAADPLLADTLQRQVARADLVIVNKTDLADTRTLERVHGWIARHAPAAQRCDVREARVPVELLSGAALMRGVR